MKGPESTLACGQCHSVWAFNDMDGQDRFQPARRGVSSRERTISCNASSSSLTRQDHTEQKDFIRQTEPDFFRNRFWGDGMIRVTGREIQWRAGVALFQRRRIFLHFLS